MEIIRRDQIIINSVLLHFLAETSQLITHTVFLLSNMEFSEIMPH